MGMTDTDMTPYLTGDQLYGDDFTQEQIDRWFADEADAYIDMTGEGVTEHGYQQWGIRYGYRHLPKGRRFRHALGFGSGLGGEIVPAADRVDRLTIVESSAKYDHVAGGLNMPVEFVTADPSGDIALADRSVDLVVCFGVLHHIANVTHIVGEFARVCEPDGYAIIREPVCSMGDWMRPRPGLTPHERGIPLPMLRKIVTEAGFVIEHQTMLGFPPILWVWRYWTAPYNSRFWTVLDRAVCAGLRWNLRYHATARWQKVRPTSVLLVLRRSS